MSPTSILPSSTTDSDSSPSTRKRCRSDDSISNSSSKRISPKTNNSNSSSTTTKKSNKAARGLRHFSMKVCQKVKEKGHTTYNEVAEELIDEFVMERAAEEEAEAANDGRNPPSPIQSGKIEGVESESESPLSKKKKIVASAYDQKNIRRRVYDALNVLMAVGIISKDKKEIIWRGLPDNSTHDLNKLESEKEFRMKEVERKNHFLREIVEQQVCIHNLHAKNRQRDMTGRGPMQNPKSYVPLPFVTVSTSDRAQVGMKGNQDWSSVMFDFSSPFEIFDDHEVLKLIGYGRTSYQELCQILPQELLTYCFQNNLLHNLLDIDVGRPNPNTPADDHIEPHMARNSFNDHPYHPPSQYCDSYPPPPPHHHNNRQQQQSSQQHIPQIPPMPSNYYHHHHHDHNQHNNYGYNYAAHE